ncbi:MAG: hypothetical protein AB7F89_27260 [Pirellulaceae bacterium]
MAQHPAPDVADGPASPDQSLGNGRSPLVARWLVGLLVVAWLLLNAALTALVHPQMSPLVRDSLLPGLGLGQVSLIAGFLVWARIPWIRRALLSIVWLGSVAAMGAAAEYSEGIAIWFGGVMLYLLFPLSACAVASLAGWSVTIRGTTTATNRWQFSVWQVMTWTTGTAILVTVAKLANFPWESVFDDWHSFALLAATALYLMGIVLGLPDGTCSAKILPGAVWLVAGGMVLLLVRFLGLKDPVLWLGLAGNGVAAACSAAVLRAAGLRLARRRPIADRVSQPLDRGGNCFA